MKDTSHQEEPAAILADTEDTESVGNFLKRERLRKNKTLREVADETCIHINTLQALEGEKRSKLPAEVFVRGFISIYAQYLGLDVQEVLNRYGRKTSAEWVSPGTGLHASTGGLPRRKTTRPSMIGKHVFIIFILASLAALLAYGGYRLLVPAALDYAGSVKNPLTSGGKELLVRPVVLNDQKEMIPGLPVSFDPIAPDLPRPDAAEPDAAEPDPAGPDLADLDLPAPDGAVQMAVPLTPRNVDGQATGEFPGNVPAAPAPLVQPAATESETLSAPSAADFAYVLVAEFTESTWLQIRIDRQEPVEYLFQPGEQHRWQAREQISLFLGNAGGVDLILNGQLQSKPGQSGRTAKVIFPPRP
jgi:cytoskeleton protein RodZ